MKKQTKVIALAASVLVGASLVFGGCTSPATKQEELKPQPTAVTVAVQEARLGSLADHASVTGSVRAKETGTVIPAASGILLKLHVNKGDVVRKGQVIAEVDPTQQQLAVKDAEAKLADAEARLAQAKVIQTAQPDLPSSALAQQSLANAKKSYERIKKLVAEGALPASQLDAAEADLIKAQTSFRTTSVSDAKDQQGIAIANVGVQQARVGLEKANQALRDTRIRATMDGTISELNATVGDLLTTQAPLAKIINLREVMIAVQVPEGQLAAFAAGKELQVAIPAISLKTTGKVSFVGIASQATANLYPVEISLANPQGAILPGMRAEVTSGELAKETGILVPSEAIVREGAKTFVFVVKEGKARKVEVEVAEENATDVRIGKGLAAGDQVVITGQSELADQAAVTVVQN
ncbi:efflux RND transporter periplasmic adaptor subunit [Brevibacillus fluminis]|uniref:efflux RND transporter periplasmic adaptor subunit n=1 Tax=Brevibacillus fluminis TaxID=511487 RepID=UPI003F897E48